jgi:hypothetical protein
MTAVMTSQLKGGLDERYAEPFILSMHLPLEESIGCPYEHPETLFNSSSFLYIYVRYIELLHYVATPNVEKCDYSEIETYEYKKTRLLLIIRPFSLFF